MAETVKKSRIVSDSEDNLEDALMEEFNMRLKSCMSQDDLQSAEADEEEEPHSYEDIENVPTSPPKCGVASNNFIQAEKEHYYDEPRSLRVLNNVQNNSFLLQETDDDTEEYKPESIYENIANVQQQQPTKTENQKLDTSRSDQYLDMTIKNGDDITRDAIETIENYEVVEPSHRSKEERQQKENVPTTLLDLCDNDTDHINNTDLNKSPSVKDRMLLSTDAQPCLLFTQTVTSPMLTPSEENIDFLKGFRRESTQESCEEQSSEPQPVVITDLDDTNDPNANTENIIYENAEFLRHNPKDDSVIYENLKNGASTNVNPKDSEVIEDIYANLEPMDDNGENIYENVPANNRRETEEEEESTSTGAEELSFKGNPDDDVELVPPQLVQNLKFQFMMKSNDEDEPTIQENFKKDLEDAGQLRSVDIMKQINKFEHSEAESDESTQVTETYHVETTMVEDVNGGALMDISKVQQKKKKSKKSRKEEKENISVNGTNTNHGAESFYNVNVKSLCRSFGDLTKFEDGKCLANRENNFYRCCTNRTKSSFSKFDALQKKNVLHVRSSDSSKAQEKFNGAQIDNSNCKACDKAVFQMEQIKAEKAIWHKNCFRCKECNKQLNVDTYQSHEGTLFCKPHFRALFAPKAVDEDVPDKPRRPELIIRENQPLELPPGVVRASDKPDLGLEELQSLNVKERFQVFEHYQMETSDSTGKTQLESINVKRSPSILSKLARFQAKGMDIGVPDESLNGIPIEESSSEEEVEENETTTGDDADLIRAKKVQKEKPFHFTGMSDVKSKWEHGEQNYKDERREERKQEIQSIRNRLFMGKQGKMKEAYQQAVMESESCSNLIKEPIEVCDTKSLKEKFEKGEVIRENSSTTKERDCEDVEVFESEISKKSRSLFLELDANASKAPQITPPTNTPKLDVKKARETYLIKTSSEDVVKSSHSAEVDDIPVQTADIQQKFKFFETYKEPAKEKRTFRITPPRDGQIKAPTPDREIYRDPEVIRSEEYIEDSVVAKESHTATKMLNKFRQMEEDLTKEPTQTGPKPLKCFTPPPEPTRPESSSEGETGSEEESEEDEVDRGRVPDEDLLEAQKAARAKQLRAKFERWEANEIKREQNNSNTVNIIEEIGEEQQSQIESTRSLRARFESMRETNSSETRTPRVKVNRFVEFPNVTEICESCDSKVYPLEKISIHGHIYHKICFRCMECGCVLRMDSYSYNQGLLYCMPHFKRLFISKGNYETGFGLGQHKEKWNATVA